MSGCISFVFMLTIFLMVTSGLGMRLPFSQDRGKPWRRLAREFGGVFTGVGMLARPKLQFTHGQRRAAFTVSRNETKFVVTWPVSDFTCDIVTRRPKSSYHSRLPETPTGDESFDKLYRLCADDADGSRSLLSTNVLHALHRLRSMRSEAALRVSFRPGQLTITKATSLSGYPALLAFLRTCLELLDQGLLTRAEGIDFLEEEQTEDDFRPLDEVSCQVCGDCIEDDQLVFCQRCHTPHHQECWVYYGSCTVYGCQEDQFDVPRVGELIRYLPASNEPLEATTAGTETTTATEASAEAEDADAPVDSVDPIDMVDEGASDTSEEAVNEEAVNEEAASSDEMPADLHGPIVPQDFSGSELLADESAEHRQHDVEG